MRSRTPDQRSNDVRILSQSQPPGEQVIQGQQLGAVPMVPSHMTATGATGSGLQRPMRWRMHGSPGCGIQWDPVGQMMSDAFDWRWMIER